MAQEGKVEMPLTGHAEFALRDFRAATGGMAETKVEAEIRKALQG